LVARLWEAAWKGKITNDTFEVIRRGLVSRFRAIEGTPRRKRPGFGSWKSSRPLAGRWYVLPHPPPGDELEREDEMRSRVAVLMKRYGILFREILSYELPAMKWREVFRVLRLMELSGEVYSGRFFEGVPGIQFICRSALHLLRRGLNADSLYWMNAQDPCSLCGLPIEGLKTTLPQRKASTHLVFHGKRLIIVSRRYGSELEIRTTVDDPHLMNALDLFHVLTTRSIDPLRSIRVRIINGQEVDTSPYLDVLSEKGFVLDYKTLVYRPRR
jgi:ATP-dependent Lhr-like helicase